MPDVNSNSRPSTTNSSDHSQEPLIQAEHRWRLLAFLGLALLTFGLDITILNTALPAIAEALDAGVSELQWYASAYTLALAATLPMAGILGDRGSLRLPLSLGLAAFALSNAVVLLVDTSWQLIAARSIQGIASAFVLSLSTAMVARTFTGQERIRALSMLALISTIGIPLGPALSGLMLTNLDFRWLFIVNVPFALAALAGVLRYVRGGAANRPVVQPGPLPVALGMGFVLMTWGGINAGEGYMLAGGLGALALIHR